jgi:NADH dehydrogenase I D subunit
MTNPVETIHKVAPNAAKQVFNTMSINIGPQHPATHGTLRLKAELDGEILVKIEPEIGFLHTGFEKLAEYRNYNQFVVISDRMNYLSPLNNNIGFAIACEEFGVEVPPRGQYIRVIMAELSRLSDHVVSVGLQAMDLGAFSVMLWTFIEREKLYDIFEAVTGARLTTSWTRVGGVFRDVPPDFPEIVNAFLAKFPAVLDEMEFMLNKNKIFKDRCIGVGALTKEEAISWGVTGPMLRACGVPYDIRKAKPYLCYDQLDFEVPTRPEGDVFARYQVRMGEMRQAIRIIEQALEKLPGGGPNPEKLPVNSVNHKVTLPTKDMVYNDMESLIHHFKLTMPGHGLIPPKGDVYSSTEVPNGELGFYIVSDGTGLPYRVRIRPPSFYNYATFPKQATGRLLSDGIAAMASINVIAGELDR